MLDNEYTIFIGEKPIMSYVLAVVTQFGKGQPEIHLKARGRSIKKAVDVAEIVRNNFVQDAKIKSIETWTCEKEPMWDKHGNSKNRYESTIDIVLSK